MLKLKDRLANHRFLLFGAPFLLLWMLAIVPEEAAIVLGKDEPSMSEVHSSVRESEAVDELISFSQNVMHDLVFTVKHSGAIGTYTDESELKRMAADTIGGLFQAASEKRFMPELLTHAASSYSAEYEINGVTVNVSVTGLSGQQQAWLTVKLSLDQADAVESIKNIKKKLDKQLSGMKMEPFWNYTVQGNVLDSVQASEEVLWETIETRFTAEQTGSYSDAGSTSISYSSNTFSELTPESYSAGSFQAALHRHSETGQSRLTIGIPAISIEY